MTQITTGLRSILSFPSLYNLLQNSLGAKRLRQALCKDYIRARPHDTVVDVGCGTAAILDMLPDTVRYFGFDLSESYIAAARKRYGDRATFTCGDITAMSVDDIPRAQIAIVIAVLHHLGDYEARRLLANLRDRLAPGGRLITLDCAYWPDQSHFAKAVISRDRGQNVRTGDGYVALVDGIFRSVSLSRRDDLLRIPYTHAVLECTR